MLFVPISKLKTQLTKAMSHLALSQVDGSGPIEQAGFRAMKSEAGVQLRLTLRIPCDAPGLLSVVGEKAKPAGNELAVPHRPSISSGCVNLRLKRGSMLPG